MDRKFPTFKYTMSFIVEDFDCFLILSDMREEEEPIRFVRVDRRWRNANRGVSRFYVSSHNIASILFDYDKQDEPPPKQQIEYMFNFVETLGRVIDELMYKFQEATVKRIALQSQPIPKPKKDYHPEKPVNDVFFDELEDEDDDEEKESNHLYLMKHISGFIKIGSSKKPNIRERTLQREDPRLDLLFSAFAPRAVEYRLHAIFKDLRGRGEWFNLEPHHVDWIMFIFKQQESTHLFKPQNKRGDGE